MAGYSLHVGLNRVDPAVAEPSLVTYGPEATTTRGAASPRYEMTL